MPYLEPAPITIRAETRAQLNRIRIAYGVTWDTLLEEALKLIKNEEEKEEQ